MTVEESRINDNNNRVTDNTIAIVTENSLLDKNLVFSIVEPLKKISKRDWFTDHFYYCLPLLIGNQYGFIIKSSVDFTATWNGGSSIDDLKIEIHDFPTQNIQHIKSHFGSGIITVQNRFHFRTPPGINLMTMNPPNYLIPGMQNLVGVIETDNLRRDFTFNIKITTPNVPIKIIKGQPISAFIPIPRYFVDGFELKFAEDLFDNEIIKNERIQGKKFGNLRSTVDQLKPHAAGRLYQKGEDANGNKFKDHQTKLK